MYSFVLVVVPSSPFGNRLDCWLAKNCWLGHASHSAIVWIAGWATQPPRQSCGLLVGPLCPFGNRVDCWLGPIPFRNGVHCWLGPPTPFDNMDASLHPFIRSHSIPTLSPMLTHISNLFYLCIPSLTSHFVYFCRTRCCANSVSHLGGV